jgi:hypothetical protein
MHVAVTASVDDVELTILYYYLHCANNVQTNAGINWPNFVNAIYYVVIVLVGNFFMLNLVLGVLAGYVNSMYLYVSSMVAGYVSNMVSG